MRFLDYNLVTQPATVVTAVTQNLNFPASNLKNPLRSKSYRSTAPGAQRVVFDMQTIEDVDSVIVMWPKEEDIKLTDSVNIRVQANATNVWSSPALDLVLTIDDLYMVASIFFGSDESYRYWSIYIDDPGNPFDYVELGMVWIGKSLAIQNAQNGFTFELNDNTKIDRTPFGHEYADEYPTSASMQISYEFLDYEDLQILENAFRRNGTRHPVIMILDETDIVFDKNHYLLYGKMGATFGESHVMYKIFNQDGIQIRELS